MTAGIGRGELGNHILRTGWRQQSDTATQESGTQRHKEPIALLAEIDNCLAYWQSARNGRCIRQNFGRVDGLSQLPRQRAI